MRWEEWEPIYLEIIRKMGYSMDEDFKASKKLNEMIFDRFITVEELRKKIKRRRTAIVFGAGPSLIEDLERFIESNIVDEVMVIVADGASRAFLERAVRIDIVVTDLDGGDDVLVKSSDRCLAMVVHAHGDNLEKIISLVPKLRGRLLGTAQCKPHGYLYNFGGFTDGDRAVFLSDVLGFENIVLAGMDFGEEIGEYSKTHGTVADNWMKIKKKKLSIGKSLLEFYSSKTTRKLFNATSRGEEIRGFKKISFNEVIHLV